MALPVTSVFAAIAALALVVMSFRVSLLRMRVGATHGDAGDPMLLRRIRAQGNFIEYVPIGLILMALLELRGTDGAILWGIGGVLALGRASHALGTLSGTTPLRAAGMIGTYLALLAGAGLLLYFRL